MTMKKKNGIVVLGNFLKFAQNENLRKWLIDTYDRQLVEALPYDRIWGIGISVRDAEMGKEWKGHNLLGKALMEVRKKLVTET